MAPETSKHGLTMSDSVEVTKQNFFQMITLGNTVEIYCALLIVTPKCIWTQIVPCYLKPEQLFSSCRRKIPILTIIMYDQSTYMLYRLLICKLTRLGRTVVQRIFHTASLGHSSSLDD